MLARPRPPIPALAPAPTLILSLAPILSPAPTPAE